MAINLHFFRKNNLEKLDYAKLIEHFETLPNFKTYVTDEYVEIAYSDVEFSFNYRYLITKQSRVSRIYELNPMYTNVNFMLEMPILIPSFLAKEILTLTQKICKIFDLDIYQDSFEDVQPFNFVDLLVLFEKTRANYIEENGLKDKITFDNEKLNIICKYQRSVDSLRDYYHNQVDVKYCIPVIDEKNKVSGISYTWEVGKATVFPPYVEFIYVIDEDGSKYLVNRVDFYRILNKYFIEIKTFLPDLYIIKEKQAKKAKREMKKIRKCAITEYEFKNLRLCDVIEK
jgi:hypothetical protein